MSQENHTMGATEQTPDTKKDHINPPINQDPEKVRMVNEIDIKTPEEQALEVRDASADIKTEMIIGELATTCENLTEAKMEELMNNPEKAKSFWESFKTFKALMSKFGEKASDAVFEALAPALVKINEIYKANEKVIDNAIGVAGLALDVGSAMYINASDQEGHPSSVKVWLAVAGTLAGGAMGLYGIVKAGIRGERAKKAEAKAAKMQRQAIA